MTYAAHDPSGTLGGFEGACEGEKINGTGCGLIGRSVGVGVVLLVVVVVVSVADIVVVVLRRKLIGHSFLISIF